MTAFRQVLRVSTTTAVGLILLATLFTYLYTPAQATELALLAERDVCSTCTYTTIQAAVEAANPGDTVRVAQGTYQDAVVAPGLLTSTVLITKDLTLIGGYSPDFQTHDPDQYPTIIDGQNANKGFYVWGTTAHIEGFTINNAGQQGMLIVANDQQVWSDVTIVNNVIENGSTSGMVFYRATGTVMSNTIQQNGDAGVAVFEAEVTLGGNTIAENQAQGIYAVAATVSVDNNQIVSNTANGGAGILLETSTLFTVTNNLIQNNHASADSGGGIAIYGRATGLIANNDLINNRATNGGGIGSYDSGDLVIRHNRILSNTATEGGGGIHLNPDSFTIITNTSRITVAHNTVHDNHAASGAGIQIMNVRTTVDVLSNDVRRNRIAEGEPDYQAGGIELHTVGVTGNIYNNVLIDNDNRAIKAYNFADLWLVNNTIAAGGNQGVELFFWPSAPPEPAKAMVVNNIIVDQTDCGVAMFNGITLWIDYNLFHNNETDICATTTVPPHANVFATPLFVDANAGNYQLQTASPAMDVGLNSPEIPMTDILGISRPQGNGVDMGAYEANPWTQTNQLGFGQPTNHFIHALEVWNNQLYAAASNYDEGASVWRYDPQTNDWIKVSDQGFSSEHREANKAIIGMQSFKGHLYASTGWSGENSGQLWRTADGTTWTSVTTNGFGNPHNLSITSFGVYEDYLYIGTGNEQNGGEIWRSLTGEPDDWAKVSPNQTNINNHIVTSFFEFSGYLYASLENDDEGVAIWRTNNGTTWTQVNQSGFGDAANGLAGGLGAFDGYLYLGTENRTTGAQLWRSSNGTIWQQVVGDGFGDLANYKFDMVTTFGDALYVTTSNDSGLQVWRSEDGTTFTPVSPLGFGNPNNVFTLWSSATAVYQNQLYIGAANWIDGASIWRLNDTSQHTYYLPLITH